jgi:hypothetical protein
MGTLDVTSTSGLWKYNGTDWNPHDFPGLSATAIWIAPDHSVWFGTRQNKMILRESNQFTKTFQLELDGYETICILGISGNDENDIFAVGVAVKPFAGDNEPRELGVIFHYDGSNWQYVELNLEKGIGFKKIVFQENIDKYFIGANSYDEDYLDILYLFDGENITQIMSTPLEIGLSQIQRQVYINSQRKVYKYLNDKIVLWKDFSDTEFQSSFVGRSESDFFNNSDRGIGHFNGIDYQTVYETDLETYTNIIFENDIFITAQDYVNNKYIVIHGRLKEK